MSTDTPDPRGPQASSSIRRRYRIEPPPDDTQARIAQRQRHIRILRAVNLIARTKCNVAEAARAVGLTGRDALQELYDLLDARGIPRRRRWGTRLKVLHTMETCETYIRPRDDVLRRKV